MSMYDESQEFDENRESRRKRRRKSQVLVYSMVGLFILVIMILSVMIGLKMHSIIEENRLEEARKESVAAEIESSVVAEESKGTEEYEEMTSEEVVEYTEEELLEEIVQTCISDMSLEDRVAGLFCITPEALTGVEQAVIAGDGTKEALEKYPVGGLIYFKQNIQTTEQIKEMLGKTVAMSKYPIFLAVDEEGGTVSRAADALGLEKTPNAIDLGQEGNPQLVLDAYSKIGTYLCELGFNVNFAPVADVLTNPDNTAIAKRAFGTDAETVSKMVASAVTALNQKGVNPCLKHFPGQGNADMDTHETLATSNRSLDEIRELELKPFQAGIDAGAQMIMVGHFALPSITGEGKAATLSREVMTDLLRDEMGYKGVIVTDALNMGAITEKYSSSEVCMAALEAGADLLLMPADFEEAYTGLLQAVKDGKISEARINDSLAKIYRIKYKNAIDN